MPRESSTRKICNLADTGRMRSGRDQDWGWRLPLMIGALAVNFGCATVPAPPAAEVRKSLGVVAIAPAQYTPQSNFSTYAAGKSAGAAKGAAEGAAGGALVMGAAIASTGGVAAAAFAFLAPYYIVTTTAFFGVQGAIRSLPAEKVQEIESALNQTLARLDPQHALAEQLSRVMGSEAWLQLRPGDAKGPTSADDSPNYVALRSSGIDTVIEVGVTQIGFVRCERSVLAADDDMNCPPDSAREPMVSLFVLVRARLVRVSDGMVLADRRFRYSSPHRSFERWIDDGGRLLAEEFDRAYRDLGGLVTDELLLVTPIPLPNLGIWLPPSDPLWGTCWLAPVYPKVERHNILEALARDLARREDACLEIPIFFSPVDSLQPNLRWEAFPRQLDREKLDPKVLAKVRDVTYDLNVWEAERCERGRLVYARSGLTAPEHRLEEPLAAGQRYFWSFRARFVVDGQPTSTRWGVFNTNGCGSRQFGLSQFDLNHDYRFRTPPGAVAPPSSR